jgi:hypothetical protein
MTSNHAETITIQFSTENDAFAENPCAEIERILYDIAGHIGSGMACPSNAIRDANGNRIGTFTIQANA